MTDADMTKREREDLAALVRRREKLAKAAAKQRAAELLADAEAKLSDRFRSEDERWREAVAVAKAAVAEANRTIQARCEEIGVPEALRPSLVVSWYDRGENMLPARRAELRRAAATRIAAMEQAARTEIKRRSVEVQTQLVAGGLTSGAARSFLETMPTATDLMPTLGEEELAALPMGDPRSRY